MAAIKEILPAITVEEIAQQAKAWWKPDNRTIIISGPSEGVTHLTESEARSIVADMEGREVTAYEEKGVNGSLIDQLPTAGKTIQTRQLPQFGAEEWTLSNGAKVIFRKEK